MFHYWNSVLYCVIVWSNLEAVTEAQRTTGGPVRSYQVSFEEGYIERNKTLLCAYLPDGGNQLEIVNETKCVNSHAGELGHAPDFHPSTLVRFVVLIIIAAISLVGNVATLVSICRARRQSRSTVYFLISQLAIADLLVTLFCVIAEAWWTYTVEWLAGGFMCKLVKFVQIFSLYLSTFVLVIIGFDRLSAIRFPMKRSNAKQIVRRATVFIWALSGLLSLPQVFIFHVTRGPFIEEFYQCVTYGAYTAPWQEQLYTTVSLIMMFLLPLVTLIATYVCTFYTISKRENGFLVHTRTAMDDARRKILHKAKMKSLMITVVIVLAFVICWTPYYCMMIIFIFLEPDEQLSDELRSAIFFFGSSTAMINPIIYGAFHLRKRRSASRTINYSETASKADQTVTLVTFRKSRSKLERVSSNNGLSHRGSQHVLSNGFAKGQKT